MASMYNLFSSIITKVNASVKSISGKKPDDSGNVVMSYNDLSDVPSEFNPIDHEHDVSFNDLSDKPSPKLKLVFNQSNLSTETDIAVSAGSQQTLTSISFTVPTSGLYIVSVGVGMVSSSGSDMGVASIRLIDGSGSNKFGNRANMAFQPSILSMGLITSVIDLIAGSNTLTITGHTNIAARYRGCILNIWEVSF